MKKIVLTRLNRIIYFIISLFTISACSEDNNSSSAYETTCDYGIPEFHFSVEGKVLTSDNEGIEGIQVSIDYKTTLSDSNGDYSLDFTGYVDEHEIIFEDIDSTDNGSFNEKDTTVMLEQNEINTLDITLTEK